MITLHLNIKENSIFMLSPDLKAKLECQYKRHELKNNCCQLKLQLLFSIQIFRDVLSKIRFLGIFEENHFLLQTDGCV